MAEKNTFEKKNAELLSGLAQMNWKMSDDPAYAALSQALMDDNEDLKACVRQALRTKQEISSHWVQETCPWELVMSTDIRISQRKEFIGQLLSKHVSEEFMADAKRRWEQGHFSSVSREFLVIGDIYVKHRHGLLEDKPEIDHTSTLAQLGRRDLTFDDWRLKKDDVDGFKAWRPKINGERFVKEGLLFLGFREFVVPKNFPVSVAEYYAGKFYVIHPFGFESQKLSLRESTGKEYVFEFLSHPFRPRGCAPEELDTHKYDGIMLWHERDKSEFRVKWRPSVDVMWEGHVWEICMFEDVHPLRPRSGKDCVAMSSAKIRLNNMIQGHFLIKALWQGNGSLPPSLLEAMKPVSPKMRQGCKCIFVTPKKKLLLILEPGKRYDNIGGQLEQGESLIDCMIREVREETGVQLRAEDFFYLGATVEETESASWKSHVFISTKTEEVIRHPNVSSYSVDDFADFIRSPEARPRQTWFNRHIEFLMKTFRNMNQLMMWCDFTWCTIPVLPHKEPPLFPMTPQLLFGLARLVVHAAEHGSRKRPLVKKQDVYSVCVANGIYMNLDMYLQIEPYLFDQEERKKIDEIVKIGYVNKDSNQTMKNTSQVVSSVVGFQEVVESRLVSGPITTGNADLECSSSSEDLDEMGFSKRGVVTVEEYAKKAVPKLVDTSKRSLVLPETKEAGLSFFTWVFQDRNEISAQEYYLFLHRNGYTGARRRATLNLELMNKLGVICFSPPVNGSGRRILKNWS